MILVVPITSKDHIQGSNDAPIILVEYGDYECPYCALAYPVVKKVQTHFGDQLKFVFRNFPLTEVHPLAESAAEAAEFASEHNKFWEMHDLIYQNQRALSLPMLLELANMLGLPQKQLEKAIAANTYKPKIRQDFLGGVKSGVNGTPTFFVNEHRFNGSPDYRELVAVIESLLVG